MTTFFDLDLSHPLNRAIEKMGFEETTPIQAQTIPLAMQGKDVMGQARTGTGKTIAFGIPMIEKIDTSRPDIQGLVVTPTRELAMQVAEELTRVGQFKNITALPVYGGQEMFKQIKALKKKPHIIVGTPGRLLDHLRRRTIRLGSLQTAVLDEADEMLNMGFIEDIEKILENVPDQRQTLLFSATIPEPIRKLASKFMDHPEIVRIKGQEMTVPDTEQRYLVVPERQKFDALCRLLDQQSPDLAIVFGRTKRRVDELSEGLSKRGYAAEGLHGDLTQPKRDRVMRKFKTTQIDILVATDVAARGLDISGVTHVYNFDIPQDPESYVHRIGRTGRAGKTGVAMTFVAPKETNHLQVIERLTKHKMTKIPIPSFSEALEGQKKMATESLLKTAAGNEADQYKNTAETLLQQRDSIELVSAALKLLTKEPDTTPVELTSEAPLRGKKPQNRRGNYQKHNARPQGSYRHRSPKRNYANKNKHRQYKGG